MSKKKPVRNRRRQRQQERPTLAAVVATLAHRVDAVAAHLEGMIPRDKGPSEPSRVDCVPGNRLTPSPEPPVALALGRQASAISDLDNVLDRLYERANAALSSVPPAAGSQATGSQTVTGNSVVANMVNENTHRVHVLTGRIRDLIARLEV